MNRLSLKLLLIFVFSIHFALGTVINIAAPDYKNETIIWKKKFDYISNKFVILDQQIIDSNGNAKLIFNSDTGSDSTADAINIYATNYNVLRIMSGMGGLAYSN